MIRKCAVCGKRIRINVDKKGHYSDGQYFGKTRIPIGKGKWAKVGTSALLGKKVNVVKWTGKEKEIEYWECNKCYEKEKHLDWLEQAIEKLYGKRCKDYEKGCPCCEAWDIYDAIAELS